MVFLCSSVGTPQAAVSSGISIWSGIALHGLQHECLLQNRAFPPLLILVFPLLDLTPFVPFSVWLFLPFPCIFLEIPPALLVFSCVLQWICGRATGLFPWRPPLQVLICQNLATHAWRKQRSHRRGVGTAIAAGGAGWKGAVGDSWLYTVLCVLWNHGLGPLRPFFSCSQSHLSPSYLLQVTLYHQKMALIIVPVHFGALL